MCFSKNVDRNLRTVLSGTLGFQSTEDLGKYLGVPFLRNNSKRGTNKFLMYKISQRLSN